MKEATYSRTRFPKCRTQEEAFEALLATHWGTARKIVNKHYYDSSVHLRRDDLEDMYQEARMSIWNVDNSFNPGKIPKGCSIDACFTSYMKKAVEHAMLHYIQVRKKYFMRHRPLAGTEYIAEPRTGYHAQHAFHLSLFTLHSLNRIERSFYHLYHVHGYSISEIAQIHGVCRGTVHKWKKRTEAKLRLNFGM